MDGKTMDALRIVVQGPVTSFRYPHFMHGVQPTYEMPPPATLYGHVCSALGEFVDPQMFQIAFHFTYKARWLDYEHTHLFGAKESKLSPFERELLFQPTLTLYIDRPEWVGFFRNPRYLVTLGRSQDLMSYRSVELVELRRSRASYLEHTIVRLEEGRSLSHAVSLMLPRYISPGRETEWMMYSQVKIPQPIDQEHWIDPEQPQWRNRSRIVYWLSFM